MVDRPVLVLNQSYEPINVCRARRAVVLLYRDKAEMLENGSGFIHSANQVFPLPTVIRLAYMIKRPRPQPKLTRTEIFNRDYYTCQYCGRETHHLTIDHVIPRHHSGKHDWENVVSACVACNHRKAGRTPEQAGMRLRHTPCMPRTSHLFNIPYHYRQSQYQWQKYLFQ